MFTEDNGDSLAILTVIALSKAFKGSRQLGQWSKAGCLHPKQTACPVLVQKVWSGDGADIDLAKKAGLPKILGIPA